MKRIEKKFGNNIYIYDVESYWDKATKKSKKKSIYVGKKDEHTGNILKKNLSKTPKEAYDFGAKYFFEEVLKKTKLDEIIIKNFPLCYEEIIQIILFQSVESKPSYLMEYFYSDNEYSLRYSSQNLSKIFNNLGKMENEVQNFTKDWVNLNKVQDSLFYDLTSISSYSKYVDLVEWGHNKDDDKLPQINFGILYGNSSKCPLLYKLYPRSISDVTTLKNLHTELKVYGFKNFTFCLDRGFYSASNLSQIYDEEFEIIIPLTFSTNNSYELSKKNISNLHNMINVNGGTLHCDTFEIEIDGKKYFANVYLNEARKLRELDRFSKEISIIEENFMNKPFIEEIIALEKIKEIPSKFKKYFEIKNIENKFYIDKNYNEMEDRLNRMGKIILLSKNKNNSKKYAIESYLLRDEVEKVFDIMKNEIDENRLRVSSTESVNGRIFINFLVLICISYVTKIMSKTKLFKKFSIKEILMELNKIKIITMYEGTKYLCELTKKQKLIFDEFKIPYPKI